MSLEDFDSAVDAYRLALVDLLQGDPRPVTALFSQREDVTLANPLGPAHLGRADVEKAIEEAAAHFASGSLSVEEVTRYATADLGYVVQTERSPVQLVGREEPVVITLRVTMIFRREGDTWKVAHRHADPITRARTIDTAIEM